MQTNLEKNINLYYNKINYYGVLLDMIKLSCRLQAVADMVKEGACVVDVGTDHGYIPAYLAENQIAKSVIACDINEKPLMSCKRYISSLGLDDRVKCVLSDGLQNIDGEYDTVIIAGMGGELIAQILENADNIQHCRLIINPMTHPELTRKWLYNNGFCIENDIVVADSNHHYSVLLAHYTGEVKEKSEVDYFLGEISDFSDREYFEHLLVYLKNKEKSGVDYSKVISTIEGKI